MTLSYLLIVLVCPNSPLPTPLVSFPVLNYAANLSVFEVKELVSACAEGKAEINDGTCWSLRGLTAADHWEWLYI